MDRAAVGLGSVFLHLKAEVNWHRLFHDLIDDFSVDTLSKKQKRLGDGWRNHHVVIKVARKGAAFLFGDFPKTKRSILFCRASILRAPYACASACAPGVLIRPLLLRDALMVFRKARRFFISRNNPSRCIFFFNTRSA